MKGRGLYLPTVQDVLALDAEAVPGIVAQLAGLLAAAGARMVPTSATVAEAPATFLTAREAANLCRCSVRTVRRRMGDGTWREGTHFHRPGGAEPRFERAALLAWLQTPPEEDATAPMGLAYGTDIPAPVRRRRLHLWPNKM